jgi:ADP-heptose:LPS heptosyltransferase
MFSRLIRSLDKLSVLALGRLYAIARARTARCGNGERPVLVLGYLLLGDLAMTGYLLKALKESNPDKQIVLLTRVGLARAARHLYADRIVAVERIGWRALIHLVDASPGGYTEIINVFSWKFLPLVSKLPAGRVISHADPKVRHAALVDELHEFPQAPQTLARVILALGSKLGVTTPTPPHVKASIQSGKSMHGHVILHIGAGAPVRLWPPEMLRLIVGRLLANGEHLLLTGRSIDENYLSGLRSLLRDLPAHAHQIHDRIDETDLGELLDLVAGAKYVVTVDTGVAHWARLFSVPCLAIMGPTDVNLFGADGGLSPQSINLSCAPLDCQDKSTVHGIHAGWIKNCQRSACPFEARHCFANISIDALTHALGKFSAYRQRANF